MHFLEKLITSCMTNIFSRSVISPKLVVPGKRNKVDEGVAVTLSKADEWKVYFAGRNCEICWWFDTQVS